MRIHLWPTRFAFLCCSLALGQSRQTPGHEIDVLVMDASRKPVPGASVELRHEGQILLKRDTSAAGRVIFTGLAFPTYSVCVSKDGYQSVENLSLSSSGPMPEAAEITVSRSSSRQSRKSS